MYKNNSRDRSEFKGCSPLQLSCILTGMKPAIGYNSYTNVMGNHESSKDGFFAT